MYRNKKRPDGSYIVHLDGEDLIITKDMIDETDPQIMREYLRMLWAQEHRERREERCRDARGVRCRKSCQECALFRSGKPISLETLIEEGIQVAGIVSVKEEIENRETVAELYAALDELDVLSRRIIELLYLMDPVQTEREVAVIVGMSQNGVHQRKMKVLIVLRELIEHGDINLNGPALHDMESKIA